MSSTFWLTNARLETGYQVTNNSITGTKTEAFHLKICDGRIAKIISANESLPEHLPKKDVNHLLMLPSFVEQHCHLDKTLLGDQWHSATPAPTIFDRLKLEKETRQTLDTTIQERAEKLLNRYLMYGVTHVRTHVDIYPEIGLKHFEEVQKILQAFAGKLTSEIVAFPQHGLLRSGVQHLVREALKQGAQFVGGVDPATVDGDIEASLQAMVELAVEGNAGIDLHLHDPDHLGIFTMKRLAELTKEAGLQGKVAISHAFGLGEISPSEAMEVAEQLAEAGITIITSVPINRRVPPVDLLHSKDVPVAVGCDNIFDVWSPFGNGDILERAGRLAEIFTWIDEPALAQTLSYITDGKTPLNLEGKQIWPCLGDDANMVFVDASCSAEAVARRSQRAATMIKGEIVSGTF